LLVLSLACRNHRDNHIEAADLVLLKILKCCQLVLTMITEDSQIGLRCTPRISIVCEVSDMGVFSYY